MNIIISNIGRRGYLVDYLKSLPSVRGKIYVSDCDSTASGLYGNNDGYYILPRPVDDEELYVKKLIELCSKLNISVVLPIIDPEIYILSRYREQFKKAGITVVVSDERVLEICFNKLKMNNFLDSIGVNRPMTYSSYNSFKCALDKGEVGFPVILKPILGSGSVDTYEVKDDEKVKALLSDGMIIQEKLEGIEYGVDIFNSLDGQPIRCVIKKKISMRSGETDKCISVKNQDIQTVVLRTARELNHIANLDADIIIHDNKVYVIDLNPRFGGGYPATHAIGVNLINVLYRLLIGEMIEPDYNNYEEGILVMKEISVRSVKLKKDDVLFDA